MSHHRAADQLIVRCGEWNTQNEDEKLPYQECNLAHNYALYFYIYLLICLYLCILYILCILTFFYILVFIIAVPEMKPHISRSHFDA